MSSLAISFAGNVLLPSLRRARVMLALEVKPQVLHTRRASETASAAPVVSSASPVERIYLAAQIVGGFSLILGMVS